MGFAGSSEFFRNARAAPSATNNSHIDAIVGAPRHATARALRPTPISSGKMPRPAPLNSSKSVCDQDCCRPAACLWV